MGQNPKNNISVPLRGSNAIIHIWKLHLFQFHIMYDSSAKWVA